MPEAAVDTTEIPQAAPQAAPEGAPIEITGQTDTNFIDSIQDADLKGWAEGKNFPDMEKALNSHRNLEKIFGQQQAGRTVALLGSEPTADEVNDFYTKLGRPEEASQYAFDAPEGEDATFANNAKEKFHELGLTSDQGQKLAEWFDGVQTDVVQNQETTSQEAVASAEAALKKEWGAAYEKNMSGLDNTMEKLNITDDMADGLHKAFGGEGAAKFIYDLGSRIGEDTIEGRDDNIGGLMTPQGAQTELAKLTSNPDFLSRWQSETKSVREGAIAEKQRLVKMISGIAP